MSRFNLFLSGIRVLDLSRHLPGPLATLLLADMGADELRTMGPSTQRGGSAYFEAVNAGKTIRRMNLKRDDERKEFYALAREADILVESFRPGVMDRLRAGYEQLRTLNPRLIYCSLSGYGSGGPIERAAGHDINYLARSGAMSPGHDVTSSTADLPVADNAAALFAVITILGALHGRARDGRGCRIDLALADAVMPMQLFRLAALNAAEASSPAAGLLNGGAAYYRVYETSDGRRVSLGAIEPKFWRAFCEAAGCPEWVPRHGDAFPQRALIDSVSALFRRMTFADCESRFGAADCCYAPVVDLKEAVESTHLRERGLVRQGADGVFEALFPALVDGERPSSRASLRENEPAAGAAPPAGASKCV